MFTFRSTVLAAAAVFSTLAAADYYIDPNSVPLSTRQFWCQDEISTCPMICQQTPPGTTLVNTCDPDTLTYGCLCGNHQQPNISQYSLTLPYFTCTEWGTQCVAGCGEDSACASVCRQNHTCGASDPRPPNKTAATTAKHHASATTSTANVIYTSPPGGSSADSEGAGAVVEIGRTFGMGILLISMAAGFAAL